MISYFGARRRVKGRRKRGAYGKTALFGIYERAERVYTETSRTAPCPHYKGLCGVGLTRFPSSTSDGWRDYNGLVDIGYGYYWVDHSRNEFVNGPTHINGIEGFWGLAKVRLAKFKGVPKHTFHLHLKEEEWLYNNRLEDKYKTLLQYLRKIQSNKHDPK